MLIDTHCHLDYIIRDGSDIDDIINKSSLSGVDKIITISTLTEKFDEMILPIINKYSNVYCSIGTHPDNVDIDTFDYEFALKKCNDFKKIICIGETGIDLYRPDSNPSLKNQRLSFEKHLELGKNINLPTIVHSRAAEQETIDVVSNFKSNKIVMHCFTGSLDFARKCLNLGAYISISGIVTFKNASEIRELLDFIPLDRMLIETDAPFLAPVPYRGKQNQPAFLKDTAIYISEYLKLEFEKFAEIITKNVNILFNI
ncbi:TatD family hydrolase [Candidatus Deianiraea vastatrix]|uniref:TatD-like DNA-binding protein/hydrolase n=1 Tax=Candidatus Deianiraea vastatrix TaxID=2163644 RepID=A0A5B8XJE0_9RICK|nr:TatD family hydrolase [Candidatus Deianiraea vastatrix]QED23934.1 Putative TatD-like DNA-binding protein/hydrolase [Candidatus Deianiraea vastatrix]